MKYCNNNYLLYGYRMNDIIVYSKQPNMPSNNEVNVCICLDKHQWNSDGYECIKCCEDLLESYRQDTICICIDTTKWNNERYECVKCCDDLLKTYNN